MGFPPEYHHKGDYTCVITYRKGLFTFSVGHLAFGYLSGKASSKLLNAEANIIPLFFLSILPDIDLIVPGLQHRGPTHSVFILFLLFIPLFATYRKRVVPYFIAIAQHPLIGDCLTGGVQLLWPITTNWYGTGISVSSLMNISLEWAVFLASLTLMSKTKDAWTLFKPHPLNLTLCIPIAAISLSTFLDFPQPVPAGLVTAHLIFLIIFTLSILIDIKAHLKTS